MTQYQIRQIDAITKVALLISRITYKRYRQIPLPKNPPQTDGLARGD